MGAAAGDNSHGAQPAGNQAGEGATALHMASLEYRSGWDSRPPAKRRPSSIYPSDSSTSSLLAISTLPFRTATFLPEADGSPILLSMIPSSNPSSPQPVAFGAVNVLLTSDTPLISRMPPSSLDFLVPGLPVGPPVVLPVVRFN